MSIDYKKSEFLAAYVECAEWADAPMDETGMEYDCLPLQGEELSRFENEAADWLDANRHLVERAIASMPSYSYARAGHDFWLTRQGHGTGYWDRGLPDGIGGALSAAARLAGSLYLYAGDDGHTYVGGL